MAHHAAAEKPQYRKLQRAVGLLAR